MILRAVLREAKQRYVVSSIAIQSNGFFLMPEYTAVEDLEYDPRYYPRTRIDLEDTVQRMVEFLLARPKDDLPPVIAVRRIGRAAVMLDGVHREFAYQRAGRVEIPVIWETLPESRWYARAVELNLTHGRPISLAERGTIARRLGKDGWKVEKIAVFLKMRVETVKPFMGNPNNMTTFTSPRHPKRPQGAHQGQKRSAGSNRTSAGASASAVLAAQLRVLDAAGNLIASGQLNEKNVEVAVRLARLRKLLEVRT